MSDSGVEVDHRHTKMEYQSNADYLTSLAPKLEDAGLEDCALPLEGIQVLLCSWRFKFSLAT